MQFFYEHMAIPKKCLLNKPLFKKLFLEHAKLDVTDKKALQNDIKKIRWVYTLKPSTVNISAYRDDVREFDEIAIIQIDLTNTSRTQRIAAFVNKAIPYPILLVFKFADTIAISVSDKRINQADKSKRIAQKELLTEWFNPIKPNEVQKHFMEDMAIKNLSFVNFYAFYSDIINRVIALNSSVHTGSYKVVSAEKTRMRQERLSQIIDLEREIKDFRSTLNKEIQFNKKLDLNVCVKERQIAIRQLEQDL
ncbi:MAG: DUF4391 domain-containing protein [Rhodobacteraceae bacterium]|nr:DUF4391 domain-containing protein [Paracoccaceae bacterium]